MVIRSFSLGTAFLDSAGKHFKIPAEPFTN